MSKKDKLLRRLRKIPPPKDFKWDELITLMRGAGFTEYCNSGSHYTFDHKSGYRFGISKTHPSGILKKYQIDAAIDALNNVDYTEE
jgi:predicted RNA binding protein YcfA (HicA-like mRNA interferase family)